MIKYTNSISNISKLKTHLNNFPRTLHQNVLTPIQDSIIVSNCSSLIQENINTGDFKKTVDALVAFQRNVVTSVSTDSHNHSADTKNVLTRELNVLINEITVSKAETDAKIAKLEAEIRQLEAI